MLSRVVNSLYWMSRYIERAENTARIVDTTLQLLLDSRHLNDSQLAAHWMPIIQATGDETLFGQLFPQANGHAVTDFLVFHPANPNSIFTSISQARENARMVRDQITVEIWEELNRLYLFLNSPRAREVWDDSPFDFLQQVKASSLQLVGIVFATVVHNEGWHFMQAGKFLERADRPRAFSTCATPRFRSRDSRPRSARPTPSNGAPSCAPAPRGTPTRTCTAAT